MSQAGMFKPALAGGVALGVLSALPVIGAFNCICCAWAVAGGLFAAYLCVKDSPVAVTLGGGAGLGLLAGAIGAVVNLLFSLPLQFLLNRDGDAEVSQFLQGMLANAKDVPPEVRQAVEDLASRGDLGTMTLVFGFLGNLVLFPLFGMVGGAIGVAVFEKRKRGRDI